MKKIWTQVKYHLKKDKGSYISFGIIILFTAFMLNLALVLTFQVDRAYDAKFEELHTATINFVIPKLQDTDQLSDELETLQGVTEIECREAVLAETIVKEFRGVDFSMNTLFYNIDEERNLNKLYGINEIEADTTSDRAIYIPLYVASFGEFEVGDKIVYEIGDNSYSFDVTGVLEEMQYGNCGRGVMGGYLPETVYQQFSKEQETNLVIEYSLLAEEDGDIEQIKKEIGSLLSEKGIMLLSLDDSASTKNTRTMVCDLLILILSAFACVILLVSVFLCKFRISNSMDEEIVNMGVLKAIGYTGNMIIGSIVIPYAMVTIVAAALGVLSSYAVLPILSNVLTLQSGFSFALSFDGKSMLCVELLLVGVVLLFTYRAARRIRKVQPIYAIRGIGEGKAAKTNHFPLETTKGKTQLLLILKQMSACGKQNVLLFFVSFVLAILVAFASTLFYNVIIEPDYFLSTLSEEMTDAVIIPKEEAQEFLADKLQKDARVESVLQYSVVNVEVDEKAVTTFVCEDFSKVTNDLCYLGENPKTQNEIALGSIFEGTYHVGDVIELTSGDKTCEYKITGFVQSVNYQGNICELTVEGYEELCEGEVVPSWYVYLQKGENAEDFLEEYTSEYADKIINTVNAEKVAQASQEIYSGITAIIIIAILVLTMLIVLFILYIVIKSLLVQKKQELGIYKAIGYSNWQLMTQLAGSFLPVSVGAVLLSSLLGLVYMPHMIQFIFQTVGAMKNNMVISVPFLMIFALVQIVINFAISIVLSMPIKKISAYSLLKE